MKRPLTDAETVLLDRIKDALHAAAAWRSEPIRTGDVASGEYQRRDTLFLRFESVLMELGAEVCGSRFGPIREGDRLFAAEK